jgi:hypothetical protein
MYQNTIHAPALTLQELRDLAEDVPMTRELRNELNNILWHFGAPELADWVIARLEEAK